MADEYQGKAIITKKKMNTSRFRQSNLKCTEKYGQITLDAINSTSVLCLTDKTRLIMNTEQLIEKHLFGKKA